MIKIPAGYTALMEQFNLRVAPHYRKSYIALKGAASIRLDGQQEVHVYLKQYGVKDPNDPFLQLEFALKYDGVNLEILKSVFEKIDIQALENRIAQQPTSKYMRMLWFFYEFLTDKQLNLPNARRLKYIDALDPNDYFTSKGVRSLRHRVNNNLLGNQEFCPILRRTEALSYHIAQQYNMQAKKMTEKYDPQVILRASHYLYTKETLSSYQIEREKPSQERLTRFIHLLEQVSKFDLITKELLVELQNIIVDPRFKDTDYRNNQNYIGENVNQYLQKIHYISPKPEDVTPLMDGLLAVLGDDKNEELHPVLMAAIVSFGFVFIHPFEDGNGRLHRFLIHYILSKKQYTPPGIIFPISAVMLQKLLEYDRILESISKPILSLISKYQLSNEGILTVEQFTKSYYQFIDYTAITEYLFACLQETLHEHFEKEIHFLVQYDKTKSEIQNVIDMPDRLIDLFIKFTLQNHGILSEQKRKKYLDKLTDEEIQELQSIVSQNMLSETNFTS